MTLNVTATPSAKSPAPAHQPRAVVSDFFTPNRFALVLFALLFCTFPKIILGTGTFCFKDFGVLSYPTLYYHHEAFWRGEFLPFWNPLNDCGAPFLAQWGTISLYPFSLIYLLFPMPWSLNWFTILHLMLAGIGMYHLAFRWTGNRLAASVAGIGYVFNGATISSVIWPNYMIAIGWMPLIVCWADRARSEGGKWIIYAALAGTMQMLSGVPELIASTWLVVVVLSAVNLQRDTFARHALRLATIVILISALSAAQLLPFFELLKHSPRSVGYDVSRWTMPLTGWGNLILPLFQTVRAPGGFFYQPSQQFMLTYYSGLFLAVAAIVAVFLRRDRRTVALVGLLVFALLFALGSKGHLYDWLKAIFPPIGFARYTIKVMGLCAFVLPLLAATAVAVISERGWIRPRALVAGALAMLGCVAALLAYDRSHVLKGSDWDAAWINASVRIAFLIAAVAALWRLTTESEPLRKRLLQLGLVAVIGADLLSHAPNIAPTIPVGCYAPGWWKAQSPAIASQLAGQRAMVSAAAHSSFSRKVLADPQADFLGKRLGLHLNLNTLDGIAKIDGAMTLLVKEEDDVEALLYSNVDAQYPAVMDFLGASVITDSKNLTEWSPRPSALPLITVGHAPVFVESSNTLAALGAADFKPRDMVILRAEDQPLVEARTAVKAEVKDVSFKAHALSATVHAAAPTLLVVAQSHYPCWRASVGGKAVPLLKANHAFQAVSVPAGEHRVELRYRDDKFLTGAAIALATLIGCALFLFLQRNETNRAIA